MGLASDEQVAGGHGGINWTLENEYSSFEDPKIQDDIDQVEKACQKLGEADLAGLVQALRCGPSEGAVTALSKEQISWLQELDLERESASHALRDLHVYAHCILSTDSSHVAARDLRSRVDELGARLNRVTQALRDCLVFIADEDLERFLASGETAPQRFLLERERLQAPYRLSMGEEELLTRLEQDGFHAWGTLYGELCASLTVEVRDEDGQMKTMGLAQARALAGSTDAAVRESVCAALQKTWTEQEITFASVLNALSGWRLKLMEARSKNEAMDLLWPALHANRVSKDCLGAMLQTCLSRRELFWKVFEIKARVFGKAKLSNAELFAPAPVSASRPYHFDEAFDIVHKAFSSYHSELGDFALLARDQGWIEAGWGSKRASGAYCTRFVRSRTPRVFMTFSGSQKSVITLAHELGHAYHSWVMRDLPVSETQYTSTLAETASTFCETLVRDYLKERVSSEEDRKASVWASASDAATFCIDTISRFEMEEAIHKERARSSLTAAKLREINVGIWQKWYGQSVEEETHFWASKAHFFMTRNFFYNFPYTFGYLLSQGVYRRFQEQPEGFHERYVAFLRDTGRKLPRDLVLEHLGMDIDTRAFWEFCFGSVLEMLAAFEKEWPASH